MIVSVCGLLGGCAGGGVGAARAQSSAAHCDDVNKEVMQLAPSTLTIVVGREYEQTMSLHLVKPPPPFMNTHTHKYLYKGMERQRENRR